MYFFSWTMWSWHSNCWRMLVYLKREQNLKVRAVQPLVDGRTSEGDGNVILDLFAWWSRLTWIDGSSNVLYYMTVDSNSIFHAHYMYTLVYTLHCYCCSYNVMQRLFTKTWRVHYEFSIPYLASTSLISSNSHTHKPRPPHQELHQLYELWLLQTF